MALSLYPEMRPNMLPLVCQGEGSLLFEAASLLLRGDRGPQPELRAARWWRCCCTATTTSRA